MFYGLVKKMPASARTTHKSPLFGYTKAEVIRLSKASFYCTVNPIRGKHDKDRIKRELDTIPGVISVSVNNSSGKVAVDFDTTGAQSGRILKQLERLGYEVADSRLENHIM